MTRDTIKQTLKIFGVTQAELAWATGLSGAAISRQLSGDLMLSEKVQRIAEELLIRRAAEVGVRLLKWTRLRTFSSTKTNEQHSAPEERRT